MSRIVSLVVLIAIIVLMGFLFLRVMWSFWLPLFLALLMALVFRPMYRWFLVRLRGYEYLAAGLTTSVILLVVFVPLIWVFTVSVVDCVRLVTQFDSDQFKDKFAKARAGLGLEMPFPNDFKAIDEGFARLDAAPRSNGGAKDQHVQIVDETLRAVWRLELRLANQDGEAKKSNEELKAAWDIQHSLTSDPLWRRPGVREVWRRPDLLKSPTAPKYIELAQDDVVVQLAKEPSITAFWEDALVRPLADVADARLDDSSYSDYRTKLQAAQLAYQSFRQQKLGSALHAWVLNFVNPSDAELNQMHTAATNYVNTSLLEFTSLSTQVLIDLLISSGILILGLFYFFADGAHMITALMHLLPLDQRYQRQLLDQFDQMSRVVVVANLINAVVHGLAAAVGYYLAGVESWMLLSAITMGLCVLPFIGAASVWTPCCIWLWLYDDKPGAALFLFIYGSTVLNLVDYGLRPWLLHGQANIHPLLAFMSILGGVQALGPIGVLVGPMIVAFLQTLLTMLQQELGRLDEGADPPDIPAAENGNGDGSGDSSDDGGNNGDDAASPGPSRIDPAHEKNPEDKGTTKAKAKSGPVASRPIGK